MKNPLLDKDFLAELDIQPEREIFAKMIALDLEENILEEISGRVTQGSVSVDGNSIIQRTCSLTLAAQELNMSEYIWGLKTKIKLYIGLTNKINPEYPDIIWFKMGTYVLTSFSVSQSTSGFTVSVQGKDKMCLLNGEIGGNLTALSYDFGTLINLNADGSTTKEKILLKDIILQSVHTFAKEPYHNIIINDLDDMGLELVEYKGEKDIYMTYLKDKAKFTGEIFLTPDADTVCTRMNISGQGSEYTVIKNLLEDENFKFATLTQLTEESPTIIYVQDPEGQPNDKGEIPLEEGYLIKISNGDTCGYYLTDLVYAGELTSNVNEPITAMLSKIVSMLGDFEYFYNLDGQFVFQRKKTYINQSWNNIVNIEDEEYVDSKMYSSSHNYSFEDGRLIASFQNAPNFANLKNDFSIWGSKKGVSGVELPIHLRYAIDKKPEFYVDYEGTTVYTTHSSLDNTEFADITNKKLSIDWREIIYQMAIDNRNHGSKDEFNNKLRINNRGLYPTGYTGYEQYYIDMEGFWRELYSPDYERSYEVEYLTAINFNETYLSTQYYVKTPTYRQCSERDRFNSKIIYYKKNNDNTFTRHADEDIDSNKFSEHPENYWVISGDETIPLPLQIDSEMPEHTILYTSTQQNSGKKYPDNLNSLNDLKEYYYQVKEPVYTACLNKPEFKHNQYYWIPNSDLTVGYEIVQNITKEEYDAEPWKYYYRQIEGGTMSFLPYATFSDYIDQDYYLLDADGEFQKIVPRLTKSQYETEPKNYYFKAPDKEIYKHCVIPTEPFDIDRTYYIEGEEEFYKDKEHDGERLWWNKKVYEYPDTLFFWFDFLDGTGDLSNYACYSVGNRPKAVNDKDVKAIYFRETPSIIFVNASKWETEKGKKSGYSYCKVTPAIESLFDISARGKSAKTVLDSFLYQNTYCIESITISAIPVYYLEPNTRIFVRDDNSGINGEYIVQKINYPLSANGMMSINATKVVDRIY